MSNVSTKYIIPLVIGIIFSFVGARQFKIGLVMPNNECSRYDVIETLAEAASMAVESLKSNNVIPDHDLSIIRITACTVNDATTEILKLFYEDKVDVIIGHPDETVNSAIVMLNEKLNMPHISWGDTTVASDDKRTNGHIRVGGNIHNIGKAFAAVFSKYEWRTATVIYNKSGSCRQVMQNVVNSLIEMGVKFNKHITYDSKKMLSKIDSHLQRAKLDSRIVLLCDAIHTELLHRVCLAGMCDGEFVIVIPNVDPDNWYNMDRTLSTHTTDTKINNENQVMLITPALWWDPSRKEALQKFLTEISKNIVKPRSSSSSMPHLEIQQKQVITRSLYMYDAVYIYGLWIAHCRSGISDRMIRESIFACMTNLTFTGTLNTVRMDIYGRIQTDYWLCSSRDNSQFSHVMAFINTTDNFVTEWQRPKWKLGTEKHIGNYFELLQQKDWRKSVVITTFVVGAIAVIATILRTRVKVELTESEATNGFWSIKSDDLKKQMTASPVLISAEIIHKASPEKQRWIFKGNDVNIKMKQVGSNQPTAGESIEFVEMRELQHDNLNTFIGACVEPGNMGIVYSHCTKGNLKEILENHELKLDWGFKNFLIADLVRGMCYLHSSKLVSHGKLTSSICMVDEGWVLKISDYSHWRAPLTSDPSNINTPEQWQAMTTMAPELLRMESVPETGSTSGDVYSFSLILHEITYRMGVFPGTDLTPKEIVSKVMEIQDKPFRPRCFDDLAPPSNEIVILMSLCWSEDPTTRPTFDAIRDYLHEFNLESDSKIMDTMLKKMENYAVSLEQHIQERKNELREEKMKTDMLLFRLLPKSIAMKLKQGEEVVAESFDSVTIFFSDIAQFTRLAANSSPVQVIKMLNDLFTIFDDFIDKYGVYKVETVGDSYMVASGVPDRNENHVAEISDMALEIMRGVNNFKISHMPDKRLVVRIGIHTGPCCAGVVGSEMLRYRLFGDTVNMAARMESFGEAGKIHISEETRDALTLRGGYNISKRGIIDIKGKGKVLTFWLDGKDGHILSTM